MASRKEQKEALRAERERKAQEAAAAERRKRMVGFGVAGLLVTAAIVALVVVVLAGGGDDGGGGDGGSTGARAAEPTDDFPKGTIPAAQVKNLDEAAAAARCKVEEFPDYGAQHVSGRVEYKTNPATSGSHDQLPAQDGAYLKAPPVENLVHELEHGRVIVWYQPNATPQLQGQLKALFDEDDYHMVLTPNDRRMKPQVAASSWTRSITCPTVNAKTWDALRLFRDRWRDTGPEQVP